MSSLGVFLAIIMGMAWGAKKADPRLEVFVGGEKPGLAEPLPAAAVVDLEMARGEFETVLVKLPTGEPRVAVSEVKLVWKKATPGGVDVAAFWVGTHSLKSSSFRSRPAAGEIVDPLVPADWIRQGAMQVPPANIPSRPLALFEFRVGVDATVGEFEGTLDFKHGRTSHSLPFRLKTHSLVLPGRFALGTSFGFAPWQVLKKHYGEWNGAEMALYRDYQDLALEHRIDLHKIYVKFPEATAKDPLAEAAVAEQSFLAQVGPLFEGKRSERGHKMSVTDLPVPEEFKSLKDKSKTEEARKEFWRKMDRSVMANDLRDKTFVYFIDEPKESVRRELGKDLRKIREWAPNLRFMGTVHHEKLLEGAFNIWCINLFQWDKAGHPKPEFYTKQAKEKDERLWFYVGCNSHGCEGPERVENPDLVIDRESAYQRVFPWMALRYGAEGILYFDTVYGYSHGGGESPWKDGFHFTGYGEGNLFYPCTRVLGGCERPRIAPALRLKILRDGLEDVQILKMARAKGLPVDQWVKELLPNVRSFPKNTHAFEKLKRRALQEMSAMGEVKQ